MNDELGLITNKIVHRNIVALKKIGKNKKIGEQKDIFLYWLYYEPIFFSLQNYVRTQFSLKRDCTI